MKRSVKKFTTKKITTKTDQINPLNPMCNLIPIFIIKVLMLRFIPNALVK